MNESEIHPPYFEGDSRIALHTVTLFEGKELKAWTVKALPHPTLAVNIVMSMVCMFPISIIIYEYLSGQAAMNNFPQTPYAILGICLWLFLWKKGARQKNVYKVRVTEIGAQANCWADIPEDMGIFFKWLAGISLFLVVCMISIAPSFIWLLAGPGGIVLAASSSLLKWKREIHYNDFKWERLNWIVIDRKRSVVALTRRHDDNDSREDQFLQFEAFLPKGEMDDFIRIAKLYAPSCTEFENCRWDGCNNNGVRKVQSNSRKG